MSMKTSRRVPMGKKIKVTGKQILPEPPEAVTVHLPPVVTAIPRENRLNQPRVLRGESISVKELVTTLPKLTTVPARVNNETREARSRPASPEAGCEWDNRSDTWDEYWDQDDTECSGLSHSADSFMSWTDDIEVETTKKVQAMFDEVETFLYDEGPPHNIQPELLEECLQWKSRFKYLRVLGVRIKPSLRQEAPVVKLAVPTIPVAPVQKQRLPTRNDPGVIAYDTDYDSDDTIVLENAPREYLSFVMLDDNDNCFEYDNATKKESVESAAFVTLDDRSDSFESSEVTTETGESSSLGAFHESSSSFESDELAPTNDKSKNISTESSSFFGRDPSTSMEHTDITTDNTNTSEESMGCHILNEHKNVYEYDDVMLGSKRAVNLNQLEESIKKVVYEGVFNYVWPEVKKIKSEADKEVVVVVVPEPPKAPRSRRVSIAVQMAPDPEEGATPPPDRLTSRMRRNASISQSYPPILESEDGSSAAKPPEPVSLGPPRRRNTRVSIFCAPIMEQEDGSPVEIQVGLRQTGRKTASIGLSQPVFETPPVSPTVDSGAKDVRLRRTTRISMNYAGDAPPVDVVVPVPVPSTPPPLRKHTRVSNNFPPIQEFGSPSPIPDAQSVTNASPMRRVTLTRPLLPSVGSDAGMTTPPDAQSIARKVSRKTGSITSLSRSEQETLDNASSDGTGSPLRRLGRMSFARPAINPDSESIGSASDSHSITSDTPLKRYTRTSFSRSPLPTGEVDASNSKPSETETGNTTVPTAESVNSSSQDEKHAGSKSVKAKPPIGKPANTKPPIGKSIKPKMPSGKSVETTPPSDKSDKTKPASGKSETAKVPSEKPDKNKPPSGKSDTSKQSDKSDSTKPPIETVKPPSGNSKPPSEKPVLSKPPSGKFMGLNIEAVTFGAKAVSALYKKKAERPDSGRPRNMTKAVQDIHDEVPNEEHAYRSSLEKNTAVKALAQRLSGFSAGKAKQSKFMKGLKEAKERLAGEKASAIVVEKPPVEVTVVTLPPIEKETFNEDEEEEAEDAFDGVQTDLAKKVVMRLSQVKTDIDLTKIFKQNLKH